MNPMQYPTMAQAGQAPQHQMQSQGMQPQGLQAGQNMQTQAMHSANYQKMIINFLRQQPHTQPWQQSVTLRARANKVHQM